MAIKGQVSLKAGDKYVIIDAGGEISTSYKYPTLHIFYFTLSA
jgi:hypothetical protein